MCAKRVLCSRRNLSERFIRNLVAQKGRQVIWMFLEEHLEFLGRPRQRLPGMKFRQAKKRPAAQGERVALGIL